MADEITLSANVQLSIPKEIKAKYIYLPSHGAYRFDGQFSDTNYHAWVQRKIPDTIANPVSVKRIWKENLAALSDQGEKIIDLGCKEEQTYLFNCSTTTIANGEYNASILFWNGKSDLVVVRISTFISMELATTILKKFKFNFNNRSPAGDIQ